MVVQLPAALFASTLLSSSSHALARGAPPVVAALRGLRGGGVVEGFVPVCTSCDVVDSEVAGVDASKHGLCGAESASGSAAMLAQRSPVRGLMGLSGSSGREGVSDFSGASTPTFLRSHPSPYRGTSPIRNSTP